MNSLPHDNNEVQPQNAKQDNYEYIGLCNKLVRFYETGTRFCQAHNQLSQLNLENESTLPVLSAFISNRPGSDWENTIDLCERRLALSTKMMEIFARYTGVMEHWFDIPVGQRSQMTSNEVAKHLDISVEDATYLVKEGVLT